MEYFHFSDILYNKDFNNHEFLLYSSKLLCPEPSLGKTFYLKGYVLKYLDPFQKLIFK